MVKLGALTTIAWWIMVMVSDIIIKAGMHHCTGGVAFLKVVNCRRLQHVRIPYKFKSMVKSGCRDAEDTHK